MYRYNVIAIGKDMATLASDLNVSIAAYSMGRYSYDAAHLHACYRQKCDKSFFSTYHKAMSFFATGATQAVTFHDRAGGVAFFYAANRHNTNCLGRFVIECSSIYLHGCYYNMAKYKCVV